MSQLQLYSRSTEIRLDTRPLVFPTRKTLALLAYLALEPGPHAREQLAALLWPNATAARGFGSLRNTLGHLQALRRQVSDQTQPALFAITHTTLALNPSASPYLDLHTVDAAYAVARADRSSRAPPDGAASLPVLQAAVTCLRGDFFAGFSGRVRPLSMTGSASSAKPAAPDGLCRATGCPKSNSRAASSPTPPRRRPAGLRWMDSTKSPIAARCAPTSPPASGARPWRPLPPAGPCWPPS